MNAIAVVRHGETDWNVGRRIQGRTEVPLNDRGIAQAREAGGQLRGTGPWRRIVTSPLGRASATGDLIGDALGIAERVVDAELLERDFGPAEGLLVVDANARWPTLEVPGAETMEELAARGARALARILREDPGSIVVAHGALIRSALSELGDWEAPRIFNGESWEVCTPERPGAPHAISRIATPAAQHAF